MYIIRNRTDGTEQRCDAIEYVRAEGEGYAPAEQTMADGFKALVNSADNTEVVSETAYAFPGRTLHGAEPVGTFEPEPEPYAEAENDA